MLILGDITLSSRLLVGTGRYRSDTDLERSLVASETELVTVAIRRLDMSRKSSRNVLHILESNKKRVLPNTAGSVTVKDALYTAELAREITRTNLIKLEVIPDPVYLLPDGTKTLQAADELVKKGFAVLPYINADPVLAKNLEEVGCKAVMPLGSPIGSGQGVNNRDILSIIIEQSKVPVVVDAGLGVPSHATMVMEMGADAVLVNSAIARADNPETMARAFKLGVKAGRMAYLAGRMPQSKTAAPSSPTTNFSADGG